MAIASGRAVIAVMAVCGLLAIGKIDHGPAKAPHGSYIVRPATDEEILVHDIRHAFDLDQISPSPEPGWGAD